MTDKDEEILAAARKDYPQAYLNVDSNVVIDGKIFKAYTGDELENTARKMIKNIFETSYDKKGLKEFVEKNGGFESFYNDIYINDFRIEDPDYWDDKSDSEIISELESMGYFEDGYTENMLDMEKMVDYCYDVDGYQCLNDYDESFYSNGFDFIRIE